MDTLDATALKKCLNELQSLDKEKWKSHKWDRVDFDDPRYHENNEKGKYSVQGITADQICAIATQKCIEIRTPSGYTTHLILNLVKVYGFTTEIIRHKF